MVVWTYDPSTQEVESGRPEIQRYPWLNIEFEGSLVYRRVYLNKTKSNKQKQTEQTPRSVSEMVQWLKVGVKRKGVETPDFCNRLHAKWGSHKLWLVIGETPSSL